MRWLQSVCLFAGALSSALSALSCAPAVATPLITYDVRVSGVGGGAVMVDTKHATVSAPGQTITIQLYAIIVNTNGNPNDDGLTRTDGSFVSSAGGLKINMSNPTRDP